MNKIKLEQGDCLKLMPKIPSHSIDLILCDLPYGVTHAKWDSEIPLKPLFKQYKRLIKNHGCIALFGVGLFTDKLNLIGNKYIRYRYDWIWRKNRGTGQLNCHRMPMHNHECISIFYKHLPTYNPQMRIGSWHNKHNYVKNLGKSAFTNGHLKHLKPEYTNKRYPLDVITFKDECLSGKDKFHPTQKPVDLLKYLIKTYTNKGNLVLDNTMGSGSTGVACKELNRKFIGMEINNHYFNIAKQRINNVK